MSDFLYGYGLISWVQSFHTPFLDYFFFGVTQLGDKTFYICAIAFLYWCVDKKFAVKVFYLFVAGCMLNQFVKDYFVTPRPDTDTVRVVFNYYAGGYSFPSGHSQGVVAFWGFCLTRFRSLRFLALSIAMMVLLPLSRLYLGVHFPIDILGGIILGVLTIVISLILQKIFQRSGNRILFWALFLLIVSVTFISGQYKFAGIIAGFGLAVLMERRYVNFNESGSVPYQTLKMAGGLGVAFLIMFVSSIPLTGEDLRDLAGYALGGFWVGFLCPVCFEALRKRIGKKAQNAG